MKGGNRCVLVLITTDKQEILKTNDKKYLYDNSYIIENGKVILFIVDRYNSTEFTIIHNYIAYEFKQIMNLIKFASLF